MIFHKYGIDTGLKINLYSSKNKWEAIIYNNIAPGFSWIDLPSCVQNEKDAIEVCHIPSDTKQVATDQPRNLPAVKVATGAEVIPFVGCLGMIAEAFLESAKESKKEKGMKHKADFVELLQLLGVAILKRPFGESVISSRTGGRKIPIPCKGCFGPHEELCGVDGVIVRTGGGSATMAKETYLEAAYLEQVVNPIGIIKIRGSPELSVTRLIIQY